jgi:prepilin-type N-terminal cleavage/methylation domain-containing protein
MRTRAGYTFVELMMVVTIMGLVASIAVNRLTRSRDRTFITTMKSDLRNFAVAQESYFYDHSAYTGDLPTLEARGFQRSPGVTLTINEATVLGWSVTAEHLNTTTRCYVFVMGTATKEGHISCG